MLILPFALRLHVTRVLFAGPIPCIRLCALLTGRAGLGVLRLGGLGVLRLGLGVLRRGLALNALGELINAKFSKARFFSALRPRLHTFS